MSVRMVGPGVHRLGSALVNWYVVEDDGGALTVIDCGLPLYRRTLELDLATLGRRVTDIAAVVLTHGHGDHVGFAPALAAAGVDVYAHLGDASLIREREEQPPEGALAHYVARYGAARRFVWHYVRNGGLRTRAVDFTPVADGETLDVPGRPRAVHTPGHTRGHCAWHLPERGVLFCGDAIVTWNPFTGRVGPQIPTGGSNADSTACMHSLSRLAPLDAEVILSGHGDPMSESPAVVVEHAQQAGFS